MAGLFSGTNFKLHFQYVHLRLGFGSKPTCIQKFIVDCGLEPLYFVKNRLLYCFMVDKSNTPVISDTSNALAASADVHAVSVICSYSYFQYYYTTVCTLQPNKYLLNMCLLHMPITVIGLLPTGTCPCRRMCRSTCCVFRALTSVCLHM